MPEKSINEKGVILPDLLSTYTRHHLIFSKFVVRCRNVRTSTLAATQEV
ncbi:hypothetical protein [Methanochimaera problematica]|nr:hypothetical protein [Methanoplanus sp. FWC-SCC4]